MPIEDLGLSGSACTALQANAIAHSNHCNGNQHDQGDKTSRHSHIELEGERNEFDEGASGNGQPQRHHTASGYNQEKFGAAKFARKHPIVPFAADKRRLFHSTILCS